MSDAPSSFPGQVVSGSAEVTQLVADLDAAIAAGHPGTLLASTAVVVSASAEAGPVRDVAVGSDGATVVVWVIVVDASASPVARVLRRAAVEVADLAAEVAERCRLNAIVYLAGSAAARPTAGFPGAAGLDPGLAHALTYFGTDASAYVTGTIITVRAKEPVGHIADRT